MALAIASISSLLQRSSKKLRWAMQQLLRRDLSVLATLPEVPVSDAAKNLANTLIVKNALPAKARVDALHVAIAATNGIDYLLTWNCRHLANAMLRAKIEQICRNYGYNPPIICTPKELIEVEP